MKVILKGHYKEKDIVSLKALLKTSWDIELSERNRFAEQLTQADAVVGWSWEKDLPAAPKLKLLQGTGAGYDHVTMAAVPEQTTVCNVFEHEDAISEYILLGMLEWEIGLRKMDSELRQGNWESTDRPHGQIQGKTAGLIGYGHIGRECARRFKAMGVRVLARTRSPEKNDENVEEIDGMDELVSMLTVSDYVIVTCPLNDQTRGLMGTEELAQMKKSAVLINVARGAIVDEEALYTACRDKVIAGAIIDTWYTYPGDSKGPQQPSKFPFSQLDNVLMSPHASAVTHDLEHRRWSVIAQNLDRLAEGKELLNIVRKPEN
jgi:phosphoglycerate dehydrogenase-like enzyme